MKEEAEASNGREMKGRAPVAVRLSLPLTGSSNEQNRVTDGARRPSEKHQRRWKPLDKSEPLALGCITQPLGSSFCCFSLRLPQTNRINLIGSFPRNPRPKAAFMPGLAHYLTSVLIVK